MNKKAIALEQIGLMLLLLFSAVLIGYVLYEVFFGSLAEQSYAEIDKYTEGMAPGEREILSRIVNVPEKINLYYYTLLGAFRNVESKPPVQFTSIKIINEFGDEEEVQTDGTYHLYENLLYTLDVNVDNDNGKLFVSYFRTDLTDFGERLLSMYSDMILQLSQTGPRNYQFTFRVPNQGAYTFKLRHFLENQMTGLTSINIRVIPDSTIPLTGTLAVHSPPYTFDTSTLVPGVTAIETKILKPNISVSGESGNFYAAPMGAALNLYVKRISFATAADQEPFLLAFLRTPNKLIDIFLERQDTYLASTDLLGKSPGGFDSGYQIHIPSDYMRYGYPILVLSNDLEVLETKQLPGIYFQNFRWADLGKKHPTRYDCLAQYYDAEKAPHTSGALFYNIDETDPYNIQLWQSEEA